MKKISRLLSTIFLISLSSQQIFCATTDELREQAKILFMGEKYEEAEETTLQIPIADRTAADYYLIGKTSNNFKKALKAYEEAIKLKPDFYPAYFNIACLYSNVQNYEKAIYYYKLSIKYKKDFAYAYYNLGCLYLKTEQYNLARKSFESAIKIKPDEPDYYYNLSYTYKKLDNTKRAEKAIHLYNELIKKRNES